MKKLRIPEWLSILFLFALGIFVYFGISGCRFLGMFIVGIGILVGIYLFLIKQKTKAGNIMIWIITCALCAGFAVALITGIVIGKAEKGAQNTQCNYLIVLGAGVNGTTPSLSLRERIDAAYTYLDTHPDAICVVSGGQGNGEDITEAQCMLRELIKLGIPESRIWTEEKSTSTLENIVYSLDIIESKTGVRPETAGILSSDYHLYRADMVAREAGISPICIPAKTSWWHLHLNYFLREIFAVWVYKMNNLL